MSTKALKQTLAALGSHQAVVVGKEAPAKVPTGSVLLSFGKSYALQRENTEVIETLPSKMTAAAKAILENGGGIITAKVAKASGLDFPTLVAKLQGNKALVFKEKGANKFSVTVKAKRANLLQVGEQAPAAKAPKASKVAPKAAKAPKAAPKAVKKATKAEAPKKRGRPAKAASVEVPKTKAKAVKKATKAEAPKKRGRPAKNTKAEAPAPKAKAKAKKSKK